MYRTSSPKSDMIIGLTIIIPLEHSVYLTFYIGLEAMRTDGAQQVVVSSSKVMALSTVNSGLQAQKAQLDQGGKRKELLLFQTKDLKWDMGPWVVFSYPIVH